MGALAITAASTLVAPAASADGVRSSNSEAGARAFIAQHSNGTSGGLMGVPKRRMPARRDEAHLIAAARLSMAARRSPGVTAP